MIAHCFFSYGVSFSSYNAITVQLKIRTPYLLVWIEKKIQFICVFLLGYPPPQMGTALMIVNAKVFLKKRLNKLNSAKENSVATVQMSTGIIIIRNVNIPTIQGTQNLQ